MEMNRKLFGILVLMVFLVSMVPLAMARYGDSRDDINDNREDSRGSDDDNSSDDSLDDVGGHRFANVTECVADYKERMPNVNETKIKAACEYAFKVREVLAPKFGDNLPRVQRFIVQNQDQIEDWLEKLDDKSADMIQKLDRSRLKECLNNTDKCKEKIKDWKVKVEKVKDRVREREIEKDKFLEANNKFLRAKNQYLQMKNLHLKVRSEFLDLKKQLAKCEKKGEDNCTKLEEQLMDKAKEDLTALADRIIQHLEKIKSKIEAADNLNETDAEVMIDKIDDYISQLEDAKDAIDGSDTQKELKEAAQDLKDLWNDMDYYAKRYAERVIHAYTKGVFVRSELLETKLEDVLKRLENKSINISGMEDLLDNYSHYIDLARAKMDNASDLFNKAKDLRAAGNESGAKAKLEQAKNLTEEAHQALTQAHTILMDLVHKINAKGASFDPDEIDEDDNISVVDHNGKHHVSED